MRIDKDMSILVADGGKILLLRNQGTAAAPELVVEHGEEQDNPSDREQKSDQAGRHPSPATAGQSSAGENDYHQQAEDRFAVHAADIVNKLALTNRLGPLVVIAAPTTLGILRKHFHKEVAARIVTELAKDMTGYSTDRIAKYLMENATATA